MVAVLAFLDAGFFFGGDFFFGADFLFSADLFFGADFFCLAVALRGALRFELLRLAMESPPAARTVNRSGLGQRVIEGAPARAFALEGVASTADAELVVGVVRTKSSAGAATFSDALGHRPNLSEAGHDDDGFTDYWIWWDCEIAPCAEERSDHLTKSQNP